MAASIARRLPAWATLALFVAVTLGVGYLGAQVTTPAIGGWYAGLAKPDFTPPNGVFAPVWTALYVMMAVAAWMVWRADAAPSAIEAAMRAFWIQLALNLAWSWIFFGARDVGWAFFEILLLIAALLVTILRFWKLSPRAGLLLLPYLAWSLFATALTLRIWQLNPRS
ncbi:MAG: tryptophan-rich sensory protein [Alphaproteobacteria bacterium]|nr:tryptophan-rich sensory protein [Alphaproteobacteria bacterium]